MSKNLEQYVEMAIPDKVYTVGNGLIAGKYRYSIEAARIQHLGLIKLYERDYVDDNGSMRVDLTNSEIRCVLGKNGNDSYFYKRLLQIRSEMQHTEILYKNEAEHKFDSAMLFTRVRYEDGIFSIYFNKQLDDFFIKYKTFTIFSSAITLRINSIYGAKLYEYLRSKTFSTKEKNRSFFQVDMSLAELMFYLGVANPNEERVQKILNESSTPDFDKALLISTDKQYQDWRNLKYFILDPAVLDINANTEINVAYKKARKNKNGSEKITFFIEYKDESVIAVGEDVKDIDKEIVIDAIIGIIDEKLRVAEYTSIAEAAEYDIERVKKAYESMKAYNHSVESVVSFLIAAIKKNYAPSAQVNEVLEPTQEGNKRKKASVKKNHGFEQHEYDFTQLELNLIGK